LVFGGVYYFKYDSSNDTKNTSVASTTPTMVPEAGTENWKVFKDQGFLSKDPIYNAYVIRYPENCTKVEYKILECTLANSKATIVLMSGGHGGDDSRIRVIFDNVDKKYKGGEGKLNEFELISKKQVRGTFRFTKVFGSEYSNAWMLEFYGVSKDDLKEFNLILDKILNSIEFIK
jgi:hypothetical protein